MKANCFYYFMKHYLVIGLFHLDWFWLLCLCVSVLAVLCVCVFDVPPGGIGK